MTLQEEYVKNRAITALVLFVIAVIFAVVAALIEIRGGGPYHTAMLGVVAVVLFIVALVYLLCSFSATLTTWKFGKEISEVQSM